MDKHMHIYEGFFFTDLLTVAPLFFLFFFFYLGLKKEKLNHEVTQPHEKHT